MWWCWLFIINLYIISNIIEIQMERTEYLQPVGTKTYHDGGIMFAWNDYDAIRASVRPDLWTTLQHVTICPRCGHVWEPRKADPVSCPACKIYFRNRIPRPPGHEPISNERWRTIKYQVDQL